MNSALLSFITPVPVLKQRNPNVYMSRSSSFIAGICFGKTLGTKVHNHDGKTLTSLPATKAADTIVIRNVLQTSEGVDQNETVLPLDGVFGFSHPLFVEAVSGEWFGYQVEFSAKTGNAKEIDERYVPEEYRTWGVSINGFDSLTSTSVDLTDLANPFLKTKFTRALPTVGCEADAIAGEVSEASTPSNLTNGGFPDGSYTIGPPEFDPNNLSQQFEFCLTNSLTKASATRKRARVKFGRVDEKVSSVSVVIESWDAPYCNGAILPGCGGPDSSFANDERLSSNATVGSWEASSIVSDKQNNWQYRKGETFIKGRGRDLQSFLLPKGLSVRVGNLSEKDKSNDIIVEAAWLVNEGKRLVARRAYNRESFQLERVEQVIETLKN